MSTKWVESGSGELGKIYFEILCCDGLPNLDKSTGGSDDCFACIIFEDTIINTEVVVDSNSPRWMPWTQRAFILNIDHPSSQLLLGIFDYDSETAVSTHDPIGRCAIDVTNLRPQTEYTLTFNLHTSGHVNYHKSQGTVTVRLRTQWWSLRRLYTKALTFPKKNYVNTCKKHDFRAAHFAVVGKVCVDLLEFLHLDKFYAHSLTVCFLLLHLC